MKGIFTAPLTSTYSADPANQLGTFRHEDDAVYLFVKNAETAVTFSAGDVVAHTISDGTTSQKYVKKVATANLGYLAGVVVAASLKPLSYGYVMVRGITSVTVSGATTGGTDIAAGDYLKGVNAAVYAVRDAATQASYQRTIQILAAVTTTTTPAAALKTAFVNCY